MKYLALVFFLASMIAHAQGTKNTVTIGQVFSELKKINPNNRQTLRYKTAKDFNFERFSTIEGKVDSSEYVEVGFGNKDDLREIIRHSKKHRSLNYLFVVHDAKFGKVLILKETDGKEQHYTSLVIIMIRQAKGFDRYMIDVAPRMGPGKPPLALSHDEFPITSIENISSIALLTENLYPISEMKLRDSRILIASEYTYTRQDPRILDSELITFFFTPADYPDFQQIGEATSFDFIFSEPYMGEYQISVRPDMHHLVDEPLWIVKGRHQYKL